MKLSFLKIVFLSLLCLFLSSGISIFLRADEAAKQSKEDHHEDKEKHSEGGDEHEHGHEEEGSASRAGPNKALLAISEEHGIQLSDKAKQRLGLTYYSLTNSGISSIPSQALVFSRDRVGVYRLRNGWFKFVEVQKKQADASTVSIQSPQLQAGDQIVVQGVGLLRVADLDAFSEEVGHGH